MSRPMSAYGPKQTLLIAPHMSAFGGKADIDLATASSANRRTAHCIGQPYCAGI